MIHDCRVMFEDLFAKSGLSLERLRSFAEIVEDERAEHGDEVCLSQPWISSALPDVTTALPPVRKLLILMTDD